MQPIDNNRAETMQNAAILTMPSIKRRFRPAMALRRPVFGRRTAPLMAAATDYVTDYEAAMPDDEPRGGMVITQKDVRQFLMAYTACFVVVMGLIA